MAGKDCEQFINDSVYAANVESRAEALAVSVPSGAGCGSSKCGCF
ncbi:hypothetical protein [Mesorhizobium sp. M5C.F.Cr.IN.023.01.1.1]|nr:hypothetical protein [Mesorhizobium sp. M5C.F.Cr.IN.023.01.1.1]